MKFNNILLTSASRTLSSCLLCFLSMASAVNADNAFKNERQTSAAPSNQVFGWLSTPVAKVADLNGEIPAGDLIADAQLMATQPNNLGHAQIALVSAGSLGNNGLIGNRYPLGIRYNDLQALLPRGMALITMSLTAQQLKYVLEQQFPGCSEQTQQRILQVSNGFSFSWKFNRGSCTKIWYAKLTPVDMARNPPFISKITDVIVSGGVVLNPNKTYRVTVNEYLSKGGDNFTLLKDGLNLTEGVSEIEALAAYLENFKFPQSAYDPTDANLNKPRITQLPLP